MNSRAPSTASGSDRSGHGVNERHGRFALADRRSDQPGLIAAVERLLDLGGIQPQSQFTKLGGATFHHLELGQGPPLVMLHGACGGGANWYRLMGRLAERYRVIALDLPGFGFSSPMEARVPLAENAARLLLQWLDTVVNEPINLAGTSFGSLVAIRVAQLAPARVRRVALMNSVGLGRDLPMTLRLAARPPLSMVALRPSRFGTRWQFHELMIAKHAQLPSAHVDALLEYIWQSAAAGDQRSTARAFSLFSDWRGQREVLSDAELRQFTHRLLIVWGGRDRFLPGAHGRRAAALVPRALFRIIPGAGHSPNWEAPDAVLECLSAFLKGDLGT